MNYRLICDGQTWHFPFLRRNWKRICLDLLIAETAAHCDSFVLLRCINTLYVCMYVKARQHVSVRHCGVVLAADLSSSHMTSTDVWSARDYWRTSRKYWRQWRRLTDCGSRRWNSSMPTSWKVWFSHHHRHTHIYLDTVPPTDVVWNYVATDKLTTQDGDRFRTVAGVLADVRATPHRLSPVLPRHTT